MDPSEISGGLSGKTFQATALPICAGTCPGSHSALRGRFSSGMLLLGAPLMREQSVPEGDS